MRNYAIGRNGAAIKVDSPLIEGWEECSSLKTLLSFLDFDLRDDIKVGVSWKGSKLPAELLKKVLGTIRKFPVTETGYVLCYRVSDNSWKVICPEQRGYGASVHYEAKDIEDGYAEIGTIHTHPNMGAFWSGTDHADMKDSPGVYVVFGLRDGKPEHTKCTICTANGEYDQELWDVFEEVDLKGDYEPDDAWVETIKKQSYIKKAAVPAFPHIPSTTTKLDSDDAKWGGQFGWWDDESDSSRRYTPSHNSSNYGRNYGYGYGYGHNSSVYGKDPETDDFLSKLLDLIFTDYELEDVIKAIKEKADELHMNALLYNYETITLPKLKEVGEDLSEHAQAALLDMEPEEIRQVVDAFNAEPAIEPEVGVLTLNYVGPDTPPGEEEPKDA